MGKAALEMGQPLYGHPRETEDDGLKNGMGGNMRRILFATDLDGTLLRNNEISVPDLEALKKLSEAGHLVVVSTGRPYNGVEWILDQYGLETEYLILANGALILDREKKVIHHEVIGMDVVKGIAKECHDLGFEVSFDTGYRSYSYRYDFPRIVLDNIPGCRRIDDFSELTEAVSLISLAADHGTERTDEVLGLILRKYGREVGAFRNVSYIDVVPIETSKGTGIRTLMEREGIERDSVYAIGDSLNDLTMFMEAGHAFTFHEVEDVVKAGADEWVSSVAECINEHILRK